MAASAVSPVPIGGAAFPGIGVISIDISPLERIFRYGARETPYQRAFPPRGAPFFPLGPPFSTHAQRRWRRRRPERDQEIAVSPPSCRGFSSRETPRARAQRYVRASLRLPARAGYPPIHIKKAPSAGKSDSFFANVLSDLGGAPSSDPLPLSARDLPLSVRARGTRSRRPKVVAAIVVVVRSRRVPRPDCSRSRGASKRKKKSSDLRDFASTRARHDRSRSEKDRSRMKVRRIHRHHRYHHHLPPPLLPLSGFAKDFVRECKAVAGTHAYATVPPVYRCAKDDDRSIAVVGSIGVRRPSRRAVRGRHRTVSRVSEAVRRSSSDSGGAIHGTADRS